MSRGIDVGAVGGLHVAGRDERQGRNSGVGIQPGVSFLIPEEGGGAMGDQPYL
jgi:hypothetical protein